LSSFPARNKMRDSRGNAATERSGPGGLGQIRHVLIVRILATIAYEKV
jgi:hypothetical protein